MRKMILIFLCLFPIGIHAQQNDSIDLCRFVVVYDFITNTSDRDGLQVRDSVQLAVLVGDRMSKCIEFNRAMMEDFGEWRNKQYQFGEWEARKSNMSVIYSNYPEGMLTSFDKVVPQRYLITENLPNLHWTLSQDTASIDGFLCRKALGEYAGRKWMAWYAEEIPSSAGPWKLQGLPGMILKAEDTEGIFLFRFCGLQNKQCAINYMNEKKYVRLDPRKFIKFRNSTLCSKRYVQNPRYYIPDGSLEDAIEMWADGPEPPAEAKQTVIATDMIVPKKVNIYQPLEKKW